MKVAYKVNVDGKVQGVFFRAQTKELADKLRVTGWVKNSADGKVEVYMYGDTEQLQSLLDWLRKGPPLADVRECMVSEADIDERFTQQFEIIG